MNKKNLIVNPISRKSLFFICTFLYIVLYIDIPYSQASTPTLYIPYGSIIPSLNIGTDIEIIFLKGPRRDTQVPGDIELLGNNSHLSITNAQIGGYITLGNYTGGSTSFLGQESFIEYGITLHGDTTFLHLKKDLVVNDTISLLGNKNNHAILENIELHHDLSIGTGGIENILEINNTTIHNSTIYLDASNNKIEITGSSWITPTSIISIWGSSEIFIGSPLDTLEFLEFNTTDIHSLTLASGYQKTSLTDLIIPLPDMLGNTLTISGAKIEGDILVAPQVDINMLWHTGTYFVGSIYTDTYKTTLIGIGLSNKTIDLSHAPITLPNNFILGIQDNSYWQGTLSGIGLQVGIIESTLSGDIDIANSTLFISNSTITGNISAIQSSVILDNVFIQSPSIEAQDIYIENNVHYMGSPNTAGFYFVTANKMHIGSHVGTIFSTHNNITGELLQLNISQVTGYETSSIFFEGDVDFTSMHADTLILQPGSYQTKYIVNYVMQNTQLYTDIRRIENILQGFSIAPSLFRNTMNGYDIALEPNATNPDSYDLVLLGYSITNDAFAGAFYGQTLHIDSFEKTLQSHLAQNLYALMNLVSTDKKNISIWTQFSFYHSERSEKNYSKIETQLFTGAIGASTSPLSFTNRVTAIFDILFQAGYSKSTLKDVVSYNSTSNTFSFLGAITSTFKINIINNHSWFFSSSFGAGRLSTDIFRPYSLTSDAWTVYSILSSFYTGYTGKIGNIGINPYIGIGYRHISGINITSEDNTPVKRTPSDTLLPTIGIFLDYTVWGFRPYFHTSFTFPTSISQRAMQVAGIPREYSQNTNYTTSTLGLEYTHILRYTQISISGEFGLQTTLKKHPDILPYTNIKVTVSF